MKKRTPDAERAYAPMYTIDHLLRHSNLPGPRGNLELLYDFAATADHATIARCLAYITPETANSPEEFVGMCGILGYAVANTTKHREVLDDLRAYASHSSWRLREAVAMGIQAIAENDLAKTLELLETWVTGNAYEQRAVVAGLCEPKLLHHQTLNLRVLHIMERITRGLDHHNRLDDSETALRKALGYGWSVIIAAEPEDGKQHFEALFAHPGKHIAWIIKENLKKNRLIKTDGQWVETCRERLTIA